MVRSNFLIFLILILTSDRVIKFSDFIIWKDLILLQNHHSIQYLQTCYIDSSINCGERNHNHHHYQFLRTYDIDLSIIWSEMNHNHPSNLFNQTYSINSSIISVGEKKNTQKRNRYNTEKLNLLPSIVLFNREIC